MVRHPSPASSSSFASLASILACISLRCSFSSRFTGPVPFQVPLLSKGSSFYKITSNFEVYGGHKSNFGGHNKLRSGALIPYAKVYREGLCVSVNAQSVTAEFADGFFNNTCIQSGRNLTAYSFTYCDPLKPNNATNLGEERNGCCFVRAI
jgi:hypothetical protein